MAASVPITLVNRQGAMYLEVAADNIIPRAKPSLAWDGQPPPPPPAHGVAAAAALPRRSPGWSVSLVHNHALLMYPGSMPRSRVEIHPLFDPGAHGACMDEDSLGPRGRGAWLARSHGR